MATVFLDEPAKLISQATSTIQDSPAAGMDRNAVVTEILHALDDGRMEIILYLASTSEAGEFDQLGRFLRQSRDAVHKLITKVGDIRKDSAPIELSRPLLDRVSRLATLRRSVKLSEGKGPSISADLEALGAGMDELVTLFDAYYNQIDTTLSKYRSGT